MAGSDTLYRDDWLTIGRAQPCAEDPDLLQVEGHSATRPTAELAARLRAQGWRVMSMELTGTLVASQRQQGMLILHADGSFTFSRMAEITAGCSLLCALLGDPAAAASLSPTRSLQ